MPVLLVFVGVMPSKSSKTSDEEHLFGGKIRAVIEHKGYKVENKLGQGAFGVVFKAVRVADGVPAAIKVINLTAMSEKARNKHLTREIDVLIKAHHPNLIQVADIFRADNKLYIFMEFAANGDISGYRKKHKGIEECHAARWFWQVSQGLAFLHETLFTSHRDIKLGNMLLDGEWVAKLTDFGFAKQSYDPESKSLIVSKTYCGTPSYECPQIVHHKPYNAFKADMWSMGVTLFIMLHNKKPFDDCDDSKKTLKQMQDHYPKHLRKQAVRKDLPDSVQKLVEDMLNPDETKRASVQDILHNQWLKSKAEQKWS